MAFQQYIAASSLTSHTYAVELNEEWCIGTVPNGGYVTCTIVSAVKKHFETTHADCDQPDTMSMQLQFLRRTHTGPGVVTIRDIKLGSQISVVHATLSQDGRDEIVGYVTQMNFSKESGLTITSEPFDGCRPSPAAIDFTKLENEGKCANWYVQRDFPHSSFRKGLQHLQIIKPHARQDSGFADQWVRFRPGGPGADIVDFPQEAIGYVVDTFSTTFRKSAKMTEEEKRAPSWYPTVSLNLDVKRRIAPGTKWLFVRATTMETNKGRFDIEILVFDKDGNLIALSNHVSLILSADRNTAERKPAAANDKKTVGSGKL